VIKKEVCVLPRLDKLTSPQIGELVEQQALCLVPVGQVEEHGLHLPTGADTVIAERTVLAAAEALHPGVRTRVVADLLFDVIKSLIDMGFEKIIMVNGHGHHPGIQEMVAREIADATGTYIAVAQVAKLAAETVQEHRQSAPGGCIHGGEFETSLMLHFGEPVDMAKATDRDIFRFESEFFPKDGFAGSKAAFWSTWGIQKSETGIYGDPTCASAEFGEIVFSAMVDNLVAFAREFWRTPAAQW